MGRVGLELFLNGLLGQIFLLIVISLVPGRNTNPVNRQAGISENVYITVQNDTYGVEQRVCSIDSMTYEDGESIPTSSPCEHCLCRPPGFACTIISCEYRPGCKSIKRSDQCCPEYQCECEKDGKIYQNGEKILDDNNPCEVCYCQGGDVICAVIDCYWRSDCQPRYIENRCCPLYDHCPPPSGSHIGPIRSTTQRPTSTTNHHGISWFNMSSAIYATPSTVPTSKKPLETTTISIATVPVESTSSGFPQLSPESIAQNEVVVSQEQHEEMASASEVSVAVEKTPEPTVEDSPSEAPIVPVPELVNESNEKFPSVSTENVPNEVQAVEANDSTDKIQIVSTSNVPNEVQAVEANDSTDKIQIVSTSNVPNEVQAVNDSTDKIQIVSTSNVPSEVQAVNDSTDKIPIEPPVHVPNEEQIIQPVEVPPPVQVSSSISVNPNISTINEQTVQFFEDTIPTTLATVPIPQESASENDAPQENIVTTTLLPEPELTVELDTALQSLVNQINENESSVVPLDGLHPNGEGTITVQESIEPIPTTKPPPPVPQNDSEPLEDQNDDSLILLVPSTEATEEAVPTNPSVPSVPVPNVTSTDEPIIENEDDKQVGPDIQKLNEFHESQTLFPEPEDLTTTLKPVEAIPQDDTLLDENPIVEAIPQDALLDEIPTTTPPSIIDLIPSEVFQSDSSDQSLTPVFQPSVIHSVSEGVTQTIEILPSSTYVSPIQESTNKPSEPEQIPTTVQSIVSEDEFEVTTNPGTSTTVGDIVETPTSTVHTKLEESSTEAQEPELLDQGDATDDPNAYESDSITVFPEAVVFDDVVPTTPIPVEIPEKEKVAHVPSVDLEPPVHDFGSTPNKEVEVEEIVTDTPPTPPTTILVPPIYDPVSNPPPQIQSLQKTKVPDEKIPVVFVDLETGLTESPTEFGAVGNIMPVQPSPEEVGEGEMLNDDTIVTTVATFSEDEESLEPVTSISTTTTTTTEASVPVLEETTIRATADDVPATHQETPEILSDEAGEEEVLSETTTVTDTNLPLSDEPAEPTKGVGSPELLDLPYDKEKDNDKDSPIPNDHFFHPSSTTSTSTTNSPTTEAETIVDDTEIITTETPSDFEDSDSDQISFDDSAAASIVVQTTTNEPPAKYRNDIIDAINEEEVAITTTREPLDPSSRHHLPDHKEEETDAETTTIEPVAEELVKVNETTTTTTPAPSISPKFILPDHLVKRVDPISDDLPSPSGGAHTQGLQGKTEYLGLGEDAENEVANTDETWFWRTYSKLRTLFPSSPNEGSQEGTRSARKPRSPTNDNFSYNLKSKIEKSAYNPSDPPFLKFNGKKVVIKNGGVLGDNKHKELKYWTSPRLMIW